MIGCVQASLDASLDDRAGNTELKACQLIAFERGNSDNLTPPTRYSLFVQSSLPRIATTTTL